MRRSELKKTVVEIRKHTRLLVRELDVVKSVYLGTGYTFTQCHVLFELAKHGRLGLLELADILLLDKSNTSRTVKKLVEMGLLVSEKTEKDSRQKRFSLTAKGKQALAKTVNLADEQVKAAIGVLSAEQQSVVIQGLQLYGNALRKSRLQADYAIRKIMKEDNPHVSRIIRTVMTEFAAVGDGYSINDPEVDDMFSNYRSHRARYCVVVRGEKIFGGGGFAPLAGGDTTVCELRKMFFLPQLRGFGLGQRLLTMLIEDARKIGFNACYVETLEQMEAANSLYRKLGFEPLKNPMGNTGHSSCNAWYLLSW